MITVRSRTPHEHGPTKVTSRGDQSAAGRQAPRTAGWDVRSVPASGDRVAASVGDRDRWPGSLENARLGRRVRVRPRRSELLAFLDLGAQLLALLLGEHRPQFRPDGGLL